MSIGITKAAAAGLRRAIQKASGLNQRVFDKEIGKDAELKMLGILRDVDRSQHKEDEDTKKYVLPAGKNVEQHLFDLTFNESERPIRIINYVFCQYDPDSGYWVSISDEEIQRRIMAVAEKAKYPDTKNRVGLNLGTAANVKKTLDNAVIKLWHDSTTVNNQDLLAFRNGTVSIKTGKISEHSPTNYLTFGLPYDYQENAKCPAVMREFIHSSFGEDQEDYIRAAIGLMLDLNAPDKCIHTVGPSGSGKGTFIDLILKMFSYDSISAHTNFTPWAHADEAHKHLAGKRVFVIDDLVGTVGQEIGGFYSGVEKKPINCRVLWAKRSYRKAMDIRSIFASTGPIKTSYASAHGMRRRTFPLPTIGTPAEPDRTLSTRLENALGDIISWALAMDKERRNAIIEHPEYYNDRAAEYFIEAACHSSSVWSFIEKCLEPQTPAPTDTAEIRTVDIGYIYQCYQAYCAATNKTALSNDNFIGEMKQAITSNHVRRRKGGDVKAHFVYIKTVRGIFDKTEFGTIKCNLSKLSCGGIAKFREWARNFGTLYPYENIPTVTQQNAEPHKSTSTDDSTGTNTEKAEITQQNVASNTNQCSVQGVQGVRASDFALEDVCATDRIDNTRPHQVQNLGQPPLHPLHTTKSDECELSSADEVIPPTVTHPGGIPEIATAVDEPWMYDDDDDDDETD